MTAVFIQTDLVFQYIEISQMIFNKSEVKNKSKSVALKPKQQKLIQREMQQNSDQLCLKRLKTSQDLILKHLHHHPAMEEQEQPKGQKHIPKFYLS